MKMPRRGRGQARKTVDLIDALRAIYAEIRPATIRAGAYQAFIAKLIDSMSKNNTQRISRVMTYAREQGIIPWSWVVDETRPIERRAAWGNPEELIQAAVAQYRKDYWRDQPYDILVVSEKSTVRGTLAPVLGEWGVGFQVMHGFGGATAVHDLAEISVGSKPYVVLYVGDHDPSGRYMSDVDLPDRLARYGGQVSLHRLAIVESDAALGLPYFDASEKTRDPRHKWFITRHGQRCWELDAMPPPILRERVHHAIARLVDMDRWEHCRRIEEAEIQSMRGVLGTWRASISVPVSKYSGGQA